MSSTANRPAFTGLFFREDRVRRKLEDIKKLDVWLEVIKERYGYTVAESDVVHPSTKQIKQLLKKPCKHDTQPTQLIVDEHGWLYDSRSCAICGMPLGWV